MENMSKYSAKVTLQPHCKCFNQTNYRDSLFTVLCTFWLLKKQLCDLIRFTIKSGLWWRTYSTFYYSFPITTKDELAKLDCTDRNNYCGGHCDTDLCFSVKNKQTKVQSFLLPHCKSLKIFAVYIMNLLLFFCFMIWF